MTDEANRDVTELTVQLLSAYLSNNTVPSDALAGLIASTREALSAPSAATPVEEPVYTPAVSAKKSLASPDHIISLIDGKPYKTLKRHLAINGLTADDYRARYGLKSDYPMVAPAYSEQRRVVAQTLGLGRKSKAGATEPAAVPSPEVPSPAAETEVSKPSAKPAPKAKPASAPKSAPKAKSTPTAMPVVEAKPKPASKVKAKPATKPAPAAKHKPAKEASAPAVQTATAQGTPPTAPAEAASVRKQPRKAREAAKTAPGSETVASPAAKPANKAKPTAAAKGAKTVAKPAASRKPGKGKAKTPVTAPDGAKTAVDEKPPVTEVVSPHAA